MRERFVDSETCGLHGMMVLLQHAQGIDGEIHLHNCWLTQASETIKLLEQIAEDGIIAWNLCFDWFHIVKFYTVLKRFIEIAGDIRPVDDIKAMIQAEDEARFMDLTLKPRTAGCLFLHARSGPWQMLMKDGQESERRGVFRIRRVPRQLAQNVADYLHEHVKLHPLLFQRAKKGAPRWNVYPSMDPEGRELVDFRDVVCRLLPSMELKEFARHVLGEDDILKMKDVEPETRPSDRQNGWAPFANAWRDEDGHFGRNTWPLFIQRHIDHWEYFQPARKYARADVRYLQQLYQHETFADFEINDDNSVLACQVACTRWHGFALDLDMVDAKIKDCQQRRGEISTGHNQVRRVMQTLMDEDEFALSGLLESTDGVTLESIAGEYDEQEDTYRGEWTKECDACEGIGCDDCEYRAEVTHPAALYARRVIAARRAGNELSFLEKLKRARRFHTSYKITGTVSDRMAGADGMNPQGVPASEFIRECFLLKDPHEMLSGGDFDANQIRITAELFDDDQLRRDVTSGKKLHAIFATFMYPDQTYESVMASKGSKTGKDFYSEGKRGQFGAQFGGDENTLIRKLGLSEDVADATMKRYRQRYQGLAKNRDQIIADFSIVSQPGGLGTKPVKHEPKEYIEGGFDGFRRYYTVENTILNVLYDLTQNMPKTWMDVKITCNRREDKTQKVGHATMSALIGAMFGIQGANGRSAGNHVIQACESRMVKRLQRRVWDRQPEGPSRWFVRPMNNHDELMVAHDPAIADEITEVVNDTVETQFRPCIPIIKLQWEKDLPSWAEK